MIVRVQTLIYLNFSETIRPWLFYSSLTNISITRPSLLDRLPDHRDYLFFGTAFRRLNNTFSCTLLSHQPLQYLQLRGFFCLPDRSHTSYLQGSLFDYFDIDDGRALERWINEFRAEATLGLDGFRFVSPPVGTASGPRGTCAGEARVVSSPGWDWLFLFLLLFVVFGSLWRSD